MKLFFSIFCSFLVSVLSGAGIAMATGLPAFETTAVLFSASFIPLNSLGFIAQSGVYKEVWTKEVEKRLSSLGEGTFLDGIKDYSQHVAAVGDEMQVIHLTYFGIHPDVLINNTTYPIAIKEQDGEDIPIALDKYQTTATPITDDELYAVSYDKMGLTKETHAEAILEWKIQKSIHALAPSSETSTMPVLVTTGEDDGTGRKRLVWADLVRFKKAIDKLGVPKKGRRLVLCSDHENDLLELDPKFKDQYFEPVAGKVYNRLGFEFYSYMANPYFSPATKTKLSFGAIPTDTDREASVFFRVNRAAKANGWTKMYHSKASTGSANST
ncbi:hypothetical protein [Saccharicrinis fermentans]|uniref:Uncharacterized protein n=2 Tax=Saccharicrinis fermentans TaxID=982 RepID=W7YB20_9BACT|nr:hypothetical protein [Saccharicrinis fermentans]GAF05592.1 hypothetical protein JCM21142_104332 [Saccharicrinis fermentans DSM 9555 = JCM 21142]